MALLDVGHQALDEITRRAPRDGLVLEHASRVLAESARRALPGARGPLDVATCPERVAWAHAAGYAMSHRSVACAACVLGTLPAFDLEPMRVDYWVEAALSAAVARNWSAARDTMIRIAGHVRAHGYGAHGQRVHQSIPVAHLVSCCYADGSDVARSVPPDPGYIRLLGDIVAGAKRSFDEPPREPYSLAEVDLMDRGWDHLAATGDTAYRVRRTVVAAPGSRTLDLSAVAAVATNIRPLGSYRVELDFEGVRMLVTPEMCVPQCHSYLEHLALGVVDAPVDWGVTYDTIMTTKDEYHALGSVRYLVDGRYVYEQAHPCRLRGSSADFTAANLLDWHLGGLGWTITRGDAEDAARAAEAAAAAASDDHPLCRYGTEDGPDVVP